MQIGGYCGGASSSVRYSETGFETPAVVGNLSQSSATAGGAVGHSKSGRLFSLLGGVERRAGIIVLPPRSTFRQTHSTATTPRWARPAQLVDSVLWNSASLTRDCALTCPTFAGRWLSFASRAADVALSRNSARGTSAATTNSRISFDALCWRGKVLLFTDHGRRTARPAYESMVERRRSFVAQQPRNL